MRVVYFGYVFGGQMADQIDCSAFVRPSYSLYNLWPWT